MDERLSYQLDRRKISHLRQENLPEVALAIVAAARGQCSAARTVYRGTSVVEFHAPGVLHVTILASDWARIHPYVKEGYFNPLLVPCEAPKGYFHPEVWKSLSLLGLDTASVFERVLGILRREFPDSYPTSNL